MKELLLLLLLAPSLAFGFTIKNVGQLTYPAIAEEMRHQAAQAIEKLTKGAPDLIKEAKSKKAKEQLNNLIAKAVAGLARQNIQKLYLSAIYNRVAGSPAEESIRAILEYLDETDSLVLPKDLPMDKALQMGFAARL